MVVRMARTWAVTSNSATANGDMRRMPTPNSATDFVTYLAKYAATDRPDRRGVTSPGPVPRFDCSGWVSVWVPNRSTATIAVVGAVGVGDSERDGAGGPLDQDGQVGRGDRGDWAAMGGSPGSGGASRRITA